MKRGISYKFKYKYLTKLKIGLIIIIIVVIAFIIMFFPHFIRDTYKVTITNKQIVKRNNIDMYLIYAQTEDGKIKVFQDTNNFLELKFNSEDLYWSLAINKRYEVKAYGLEIPILLHYQNIIKAKGIEAPITPAK